MVGFFYSLNTSESVYSNYIPDLFPQIKTEASAYVNTGMAHELGCILLKVSQGCMRTFIALLTAGT